MKSLLLILALGCALPALASGQSGTPGFESMKIEARTLPDFPLPLRSRGVTRGEVRVVAMVDETGRLAEWLVTAYSHEELVDEAIEAMKQWHFTPARLNGEPVPAQSEILISFRLEGVVVSQNMTEHFLDHTRFYDRPVLAYRPITVREIDRIPNPREVVSPVYDETLRASGVRGDVTIDFYIDEQGRVRMPVVAAADSRELAALAIDAVRRWSFEPPTRRGQPVLVQARQHFHFSGAAPEPAEPVASGSE